MDPNRDQTVDHLATTDPPGTGSSWLQGLSDVPVWMGLAHLLKILHVPPCLPDTGGTMVVTVGPSSPSPERNGPPSKMAHLGSIGWGVFSVCAWICLLLMRLLLLLLTSMNSQSDLHVVGVIPWQLRSPGGWLRVR
jgi:hypothetical protein